MNFLRAGGDTETPREMVEMVIEVADTNGDHEMSWDENIAFSQAQEPAMLNRQDD